jgi:hypothetical protein
VRNDYPKCKDSWWSLFDANRDDLRAMVSAFHPNNQLVVWDDEFPITAKAAEAACEVVRRKIRKEDTEDPLAKFERLSLERSPEMDEFLSAVWFGIPESVQSRSVPGFFRLCDLCETAEFLHEDEG